MIPDGSAPIALSSPNVANLTGGPAVVVGDEAGNVYAYRLATGAPVWTYKAGAPVNSTPSVAALTAGSNLDTVFVGGGDAGSPTVGGYQAISPTGGDQWFVQESNPSTDPTAHSGVQASLAVGDLQGGTDVTAGSLGQNQYALNAANGSMLNGFPWFQADSDFTTPALADLYDNGQTEIVEGGDSTAGIAYGVTYANGGHLRVLSPTGNAGGTQPGSGLDCEYNTNETVESSPAVGEFFGSSATVGIVFGTGATYGQSDTDKLIAVDSHCNFVWSASLNGNTKSSPALADVLGNGQLQVVEGTDNGSTGSVYALNGANGATLWSTPTPRVIGSVVTANLGSGYQDVLAPTVNGVVVLDGKTGSVITTLQGDTGFQNSPLITDDPNGTVGITLAGYQSGGSIIYHYEIAGSNGSLVNEAGAWPEFHHDPQLTGDAGTAQNIEVPCTAPRRSSQWLRSHRLRRGRLHLRQPAFLRFDRRHRTQQTSGRHGGHARRRGLLVGGLRRRDLQLRGRQVLRLDGRHPSQPAHRGNGGHSRRRGLLVGGLRRRDLQLRRRQVLRLDGRHPPEPSGGRHGGHP